MNRFLFLLVMVPVIMMTAQPVWARAIDRTIAKINDDIVTESDLAQVIAELRGEHRTAGIDAFAEATSVTVGSLLDRQLLLQEARRLQIRPSDDELHRQVEDMVREVKDNFASESEFYHALAQERLSLDRFKDQLLKQTRDDFMVYHVVDSRFSVSDAEVESFKHRETESAPIRLRLRRLGIAITKKVSSQEACKKARAMVGQTISDGVSFEEGVRKYSEVPGAAQDGGDMGYMALDGLSSEVRSAVENLNPGQASAPVVAGGYANIFYVEGKRGARVAVREQKFVEARGELLESLRRRAILQVFDERLLPLLPTAYLTLTDARPANAESGSRQRTDRANAEQGVVQGRAAVPAASPTPVTQQVLFAPRPGNVQQSGSIQQHQGNSPQQGYVQPSMSGARPQQSPHPGYIPQQGYAPHHPTPTPSRGWFGRTR